MQAPTLGSATVARASLTTMATVCTPLALGAKLSVRGTKVVNKRVPAPKPMRFVAKAQISKGAHPQSATERRFRAKSKSSHTPRTQPILFNSPTTIQITRIAVNKAAAVAAMTTLVVTPSANASELGEVRSRSEPVSFVPLGDRGTGGFANRRIFCFFYEK